MNVFDFAPVKFGSCLPSAALLLVSALAGCAGPAGHRAPDAQTVQGIRAEAVRLQDVPDEVEASGFVIAESTARVAARTMGTVTQIAVREGDLVKRGQLLAQLDERELVARRNAARAGLQEAAAAVAQANRAVAAAQAQADVAKKTYDRYVYLREQKSVSPQEFDEVEAKYRAAQAGLEQASALLQQAGAAKDRAESEARAADEVAGYARVVAPFDGRLLRRTVELGSLITPGTPLFIVEDASHYQLEVTLAIDAVKGVPGSAASIQPGSRARVAIDALPGQPLSAAVKELEAGADPSSHTLRARLDLPRNPAIQSGLFGRAWFHRGNKHALLLPASALLERGQLRGVFIVAPGGIARWRVVTPGQRITDQVEILSGLSEGEAVVQNPGNQDLDGKKVAAPAPGGGEKTR